jgi:hypothetical protein
MGIYGGGDARGEVFDLDGTGVDADENSDVEVDTEGDEGLDVAPVPPSRRCNGVQNESESLSIRVSHLTTATKEMDARLRGSTRQRRTLLRRERSWQPTISMGRRVENKEGRTLSQGSCDPREHPDQCK